MKNVWKVESVFLQGDSQYIAQAEAERRLVSEVTKRLYYTFRCTGVERVSTECMNIEIFFLTSSLEIDDWVANHICPW